jgi:hypothetical protein
MSYENKNINKIMEYFAVFRKNIAIAKEKLQPLLRTHLKNRILVQDRGGTEFQTGGILLYVEDLKRGTNKDIGPKDIFKMDSR